MEKKMMVAAAFLLAFAVGCADEKEQEERNARISENAQNLEKGLQDMVKFLERGPRPTAADAPE